MSLADPTAEREAPEETGSRYRILMPLAEGGMGTVHLAVQRGAIGFSRLVAVKRPHTQAMRSAELRASFAREARIAAAVRHVNVAAVLDVEEQGEGRDGEVTLILEYVEGASLAELVRSLTSVPIAAAGRILLDVARGLHAAHETHDAAGDPLSIVHRDVTPHNVLVGIDGVARISDFGVAKATAGALVEETRSTTLKGKLAYMAPEYLQTSSCDRRADVFSLGVIAWELLTGERLFRAQGEFETMRRVMEADISAPSQLNPRVPQALDAVVLGALARDTTRRFPTALGWAHALEASLRQAGFTSGPEEVSALVEHAVGPALRQRREAIRSALHEPLSVPSSPGRPMDEATAELATPAPVVGHAASPPLAADEAAWTHAQGAAHGTRTPFRVRRAAQRTRWLWYVAGALLLFGVAAAWWQGSRPDAIPATAPVQPARPPAVKAPPHQKAAKRQIREEATLPAPTSQAHPPGPEVEGVRAAPAPMHAAEVPEKQPPRLRQAPRRPARTRPRKTKRETPLDTAPPNPYR